MGNNNTNKAKKDSRNGSGKFPVISVFTLIIGFFAFVYSAAGLFFALKNEYGNDLKFTENSKGLFESVFRHDLNSSNGKLILASLIFALGLGLFMIIHSFVKLSHFGWNSKSKTPVLILLTLVALALSLFGAYQLYWNVQLPNSGRENKNSGGTQFDYYKDKDGYYYSIDGAGDPYLTIELSNVDTTGRQINADNDDYTSLRKKLGVLDIDCLTLHCDYSGKPGNDDMLINYYYFEHITDGEKNKVIINKLRSGQTGHSSDSDITLINHVPQTSNSGGQGSTELFFTLQSDNRQLLYKAVKQEDFSRSDPDKMTTFLIVGKDNAGLNTDVMILVSLKNEKNSISAHILQLPRDTYCRDSASNNKINAVYGSYYNDALYKGEDPENETHLRTIAMKGLVSVLEKNMSFKIDHWAIMDLSGFGGIVDAIGGVDMYVPFDMHYDDPAADPPLIIDLKEGQQNLNGKKAEQYIRFRHDYIDGDLGRVNATKIFLTAFFVKLRSELSLTNPTAINGTIGTLMNYVVTDMDLGTAVKYTKIVLKLGLEDITFLNLPGDDSATDDSGASYYTMTKKGAYYVINTYFNVSDSSIDYNSFDSSRIFTSYSGSAIDGIYTRSFDDKAYENNSSDAAEIKDKNDSGNSIEDLLVAGH